jgi:hypothetical protein
MPRDVLVNEYQRLMTVSPWPALRATIRARNKVMPLTEIDVANRSLRLLVVMYETKQKMRFLNSKDQAVAIALDDDRALIVHLTDALGGAAASGSSGVQDSAMDAPSSGVQDSADTC